MDKKDIRRSIVKLVMVLLCMAMSVVSYVFLSHFPKYILIILIVAFSSMGIGIACVNHKRFETLYKLLLTSIVGAAIILTCYVLLDVTGVLDKITSFDVLKQFILNTKQWGIIVFVLLTVFQVVVLPIPEAVTILLGVAIYGATWSFVLSVIGTVIGSLISFMLGKVFGRKLCNWMFGADNTEKYARILSEKGKFLFIIMLLFPAFPDDMLCMIAGITSMSYAYFTVICLVTRPVMIGLTAYLGSGAIPFSGWGIPVWIALVCLMFAAFVVISGLRKSIESRKPKRR